MKKFATLALLLSLGLFTVGCESKKEPASTAPPAGGAAAPADTGAAPPADGAAAPADGGAAPAETK